MVAGLGRYWLIGLAATVLIFWIVVLNNLNSLEPNKDDERISELGEKLVQLEKQLGLEHESLRRLESDLQRIQDDNRKAEDDLIKLRAERHLRHPVKPKNTKGRGPWPNPIPVLLFVCNRATAAKAHIEKLIKYRPSSDRFPIIVSQDCDSEPAAKEIRAFGEKVEYIKHLSGEKANIVVAAGHERWVTYYRIARHYKLALTHVFDELGHDSVIINEDDLDIAPDFFDYFAGTRYLLEEDSSLYCISAWNDNGKPHNIDSSAPHKLYRTDFFPGLGWLLTKKIWNEMKPKWPQGFWDDWMREPEQRLNRSCIRPEVSRTAMTQSGKRGASTGLFFTKHLSKIKLNTSPVRFPELNLDYLKKSEYDSEFNRTVYAESPLVTTDEVYTRVDRSGSVRVEYTGNIDYIEKAIKLQIMNDFKAGVPRTAYQGVVTCVINGLRVYLVPDRRTVHGYDKQWEVPIKYSSN